MDNHLYDDELLNMQAEELKSELKMLNKMDNTSKEYQEASKAYCEQMDRFTQREKLYLDEANKETERSIQAIETSEKNEREREAIELEKEKLEHEKKNNRVRNVIQVGTTVLCCGVTIWSYLTSWKHEYDNGEYLHDSVGKNVQRDLFNLWKK